MITKTIKQFLLAGMVSCGMAAGLTACSDWNDHYESAADGGAASGTLWEQMKANPQLSDFCDVLEQTKVYRMHTKTPVSYKDILSGGQSFTVMAPMNDTFNKDSLLQLVQTVVGDSAVEKGFVKNHITRSLASLTPSASRLLMLNQNHLWMENGMIDEVPITVANTKTSNGIFHILEHGLPYKHNLYEMFCDNPSLSGIGDNLRRFNEDVFDPDASVSNGVIDGVPIYVDSVVYERNRLLDAIGYLNEEDSTYLVVAPTAEGWNEAYNEVSKYFLFDESVEKRDSMQQYYTMRALMEDAIFNMTDQKNINDSLLSVPYIHTTKTFEKGKKVYHVFQKPFEPGGIMYGATPITCSNGILYTTPKWPFNPLDTYFKDIYAEGENQNLYLDWKYCSYNTRRVTGDSISNNGFLQIIPSTSTSNWEITFRINNTLSGDYDVCAIVLPQSVNDLNNTNPCKFKATISYIDEKNQTQTFSCGNNKQFQSDPERIDTIVLAEAFHFPVCNYDQNKLAVSIKLTCSILPRETTRYSREMLLDCIYLRPRISKSEEQ